MKTIWEYPVMYKYGNDVPGYSGFHSGEDRGNSTAFGLPVPVNGNTIGTVGWTGYVDPKDKNGTHLHVGKWKGGSSFNPNGGGKTLANTAVVTQVDTIGKTDNGKFVRVNADGYDWVYLHLNSVNAKVGDKLTIKGENMAKPDRGRAIRLLRLTRRGTSETQIKGVMGKEEDVWLDEVYRADWFKEQTAKLTSVPSNLNKGDLHNMYIALLGRAPDAEANKAFIGRPWGEVFYKVIHSPEYAARQKNLASQSPSSNDEQVKQSLKDKILNLVKGA